MSCPSALLYSTQQRSIAHTTIILLLKTSTIYNRVISTINGSEQVTSS
uniref:Uncharacterized protein n=1 Tax=Anguilla anguilla TaxID=7936 RepID=A0A0E9SMX5_ANGAN